MTVSVMITTRNRQDELRRTLSHLRALAPGPDEVIITADGCTDGTAAMVRSDFPECILIENAPSRGSVFSRDQMLRRSRGDTVLSLDDDSYPIDVDFLSRLEEAFDEHPEASVITFAELRGEDAVLSGPGNDLQRGRFVAAYPNCAAAMRRCHYGAHGAFAVLFGHMYEEPDYALQSYAAGFGVWFEPSLRVRHHLTTAQRQPVGRHHLNARNEFWSVWLRCPWPWLPFLALYRLLRQFGFACSQGVGWAFREPAWWWMALRGLPQVLQQRRPVPWRAYRFWLRLNRECVNEAVDLKSRLGIPDGKISMQSPAR